MPRDPRNHRILGNLRSRTIAASLALLATGTLGACTRRPQPSQPASRKRLPPPQEALLQRVLAGMAKRIGVGARVPAAALPAHDGRRISLRDFAGRKVLLWFYPKADTPG